MPSELNKQIQSSSSTFIGLQSYSEAQAASFFGRDTEINDLTRLVKLNTLTIVFGKSGTGKTSLLNAGVFPLLRKNFCLPFRLRLDFNNDSPDLVTQIKKVLKQEIDAYGFKAESYPSSETLWEYFHKEPLWKTVTPILVFDQFEEIFTLAKKNPRFGNEELVKFWEELSDLAENSIPKKLKATFLNNKEEIGYNYKNQKVKIVFAFREEYLPEFESITTKIPSIKSSRFRLLPMNGHQAYEVITKTWKENIQSSEGKKIVTYLTKEKDLTNYDLVTIEPSLLSQVCAFIDRKRIETGLNNVSAKLLSEYEKDTILRSIYEEAIASSSIILPTKSGEKPGYNILKEFLEEKMITSEGFRTKYSLTGNDEPIRPGVEALKEKYFIRQELNAVELTHDVLAPIIKTDREKRRSDEALKIENKKARKRGMLLLLIVLLAAAATYYFVVIKAKKEKERQEARIKILKEDFKKDSIRQLHYKDSISNIIKYIESRINGTIIIDPNEKKKIDSLVANLKKMNDSLALLKVKHDKDLAELHDLQNRPRLLKMPKPVFPPVEESPEYIKLFNEYNAEIVKYKALMADYEKLKKQFDAYIKRIPDPVPIKPDKTSIDTTNNLRLDLFYSITQNGFSGPPENTIIYLIPYSGKNNKIIKNAKVYEINCNEPELKKAEGFKTAKYYNGKFIFSNVNKGKYFIKICTYYGGYYNYTKNSNEAETVRLDASPPIR